MTKLDKIIGLIKSKYFVRIILFLALIGMIITGFRINYNKKTGEFGCEKSKIDIDDFKSDGRKSNGQTIPKP